MGCISDRNVKTMGKLAINGNRDKKCFKIIWNGGKYEGEYKSNCRKY